MDAARREAALLDSAAACRRWAAVGGAVLRRLKRRGAGPALQAGAAAWGAGHAQMACGMGWGGGGRRTSAVNPAPAAAAFPLPLRSPRESSPPTAAENALFGSEVSVGLRKRARGSKGK